MLAPETLDEDADACVCDGSDQMKANFCEPERTGPALLNASVVCEPHGLLVFRFLLWNVTASIISQHVVLLWEKWVFFVADWFLRYRNVEVLSV